MAHFQGNDKNQQRIFDHSIVDYINYLLRRYHNIADDTDNNIRIEDRFELILNIGKLLGLMLLENKPLPNILNGLIETLDDESIRHVAKHCYDRVYLNSKEVIVIFFIYRVCVTYDLVYLYLNTFSRILLYHI